MIWHTTLMVQLKAISARAVPTLTSTNTDTDPVALWANTPRVEAMPSTAPMEMSRLPLE